MEPQPPPIPGRHPAYAPAPPRPSRLKWVLGILLVGGGLMLMLFVFLIFAGIAAAIKQAGNMAEINLDVNEEILRDRGPEKIAHIDLEGVITATSNRTAPSMVDDFASHLEAALDDEMVKAIVVRINSPGGEVTASDRLYHMLKNADAKKPVVSYMDTIAASGGYYAACGTRHLMAHPTTFTGSIGVIMQTVKYGEMLDKLGLAFEVYKSGEMKDLLAGNRETLPEEIALVNELVSETYDRFLEVVAENRGRPASELRGSPFTDGRIFSGSQGLAGGFIDSNGFIDDAYDMAAELAGVISPTVVRYQNRPSLMDLFDPFATAKTTDNKLEIDVSERLLPRIQSGVPLYLHLDAL